MEKPPQLPNEDEINFHDVHTERKELRQALREVLGTSLDNTVGGILKNDLEKADEKAEKFKIKNHGGLSEAKKFLKAQKEQSEENEWIDNDSISEELGPSYAELISIREDYSDAVDFEIKKLREAKSNPVTAKVYSRVRDAVVLQKQSLSEREREIGLKDMTLVRAVDLVEYKKGLHTEGHIAHTPTVEKSIQEIAMRMVSGKPMFLHGPTGTGKTSLARYSAEHFTGQKAEMVYCNPQTRESNIWGKTGIKPTGEGGIETVDVYGPLARAMQEGKVVIFDEFTALPREQMVFIKGILNAKIGDTVNVMGNGTVQIQPGFQLVFTANLKSDKNPERQELPPEIAREFEQNNLEVGYTPKEEAYDIVLSRLMNSDGSIDLSYYDLNTTIPKFLEAMEEVQIAYTDKASETTAKLTGSMDVSGKRVGLKKLVFTQGTVEAILDQWKTQKLIGGNETTFVEFLDDRLKTALNFKEYPESDRVLVAKILASKGLLRTVSAKDLGLPESVFAFDIARTMRANSGSLDTLLNSSRDTKHIPLKQVADLDPFGVRKSKALDMVEDFMDKSSNDESVIEKDTDMESIKGSLNTFLLDTYRYWGIHQDKLNSLVFNPQILRPSLVDYEGMKVDVDDSKYGEYTINPETIGIDWETVSMDRIRVLDLANMKGKGLSEVAEYITQKYGDKYYIPGLEYYKYIYKNPNKAPDKLKDGNYYFMFGSLFRHSDGGWNVPFVQSVSSGFGRGGDWLDSVWNVSYRVVLLER